MTTTSTARLMVTRGVKRLPFQHPRLSLSGPTVVIIMEHSLPNPPAGAFARHRAAGARPADDAGPQVQLPLQAQLRSGVHAAEKAGADEALMLDSTAS